MYWSRSTATNHAFEKHLAYVILPNSWTQQVKWFAQMSRRTSPFLFDLVILNEEQQFNLIRNLPPLVKFDHLLLPFDYILGRASLAPESRIGRSYKTTIFDSLNAIFQSELDVMEHGLAMDTMAEKFERLILREDGQFIREVGAFGQRRGRLHKLIRRLLEETS